MVTGLIISGTEGCVSGLLARRMSEATKNGINLSLLS